MAGRIHDEDIALVRERARIDEVVSRHVALKGAGSGSMKGLCPFHDEKTPSFQVSPARGFYYCFGCGAGGDVITFVQEIDNLSFSEAVQSLADRVGVQLRIVEDGQPSVPHSHRTRVIAANVAAQEFFAAQLASPDALTGRQFLDGRGFDREAALHFGVGYAPRGGRELRAHLNKLGFSDEELIRAGLIRESRYDFFQGRLVWPIRDSASSVLGFGARRLFDDDRMPAKYLNTPETPIYKKSHVLYGLDLARQPIGKKGQAVVVEGYTDVMAAHLAGVDTAVASCGTAFGADHGRILQRLLGHQGAQLGEVIFTFDGDAAGQKAALKVFDGDSNFAAQTYVAVEPTGLDPCDLRLEHGDAAVRELVARRIPLYRFVMHNIIDQYDLDRAEGRIAALRAAAPLVSSIRDQSLVGEYARELAGMVGVDLEQVRHEVRRAPAKPSMASAAQPAPRSGRSIDTSGSQASPGQTPRQGSSSQQARNHTRSVEPSGGAGASLLGPHDLDEPPLEEPPPEAEAGEPGAMPWPDPSDPRLAVERGTLQLMLQVPTLFDTEWDGLSSEDFTHPMYRAIFETIKAIPWHDGAWIQQVQQGLPSESLRQLAISLLVEPLKRNADETYASAYAARLQLHTTTRHIADIKSRLQRMNPLQHETEHRQLFSTLLDLERHRKYLQHHALGAVE